jgi:hypothetical protein
MTPPTARDVLVGVAPYGQLGHNLPGSNNYFDCGGRQRSRGMRVSGRAPAGPSPARVPEQGRAATRRGPDAGGRAVARSHALTFSARPCARRCHRRRNPRQCGQGFGHGLAFAVGVDALHSLVSLFPTLREIVRPGWLRQCYCNIRSSLEAFWPFTRSHHACVTKSGIMAGIRADWPLITPPPPPSMCAPLEQDPPRLKRP